MGIQKIYQCDLTDVSSVDINDVVIFDITRDGEKTTTVVHSDVVAEELEDDESFLVKIIFRDSE